MSATLVFGLGIGVSLFLIGLTWFCDRVWND
jgi:hypothetical protein